MIVGTLEVHLRLDGCFSLKDKRQVLRSLLDRAKRDFQVAAAEVGDHDLWNVATVGFACVGNDARHVERVIQHVLDFVDAFPDAVVESAVRDIERAG